MECGRLNGLYDDWECGGDGGDREGCCRLWNGKFWRSDVLGVSLREFLFWRELADGM